MSKKPVLENYMFWQAAPPVYMAGIRSSETADPYGGSRALAIVVGGLELSVCRFNVLL